LTIPRDLLDEVHREIASSCRLLGHEVDRLRRLVELNRLALLVSLRLGRRISIVELFEELGDEAEELETLVRSLRDEQPR
jgi:hypothetical protein